MAYAELDGFRQSIRQLYQKGGPFKNAADKVMTIWARAHQGMAVDAVFAGAALTHSGESRVPHSRKYELPGRARLIIVLHENICMFLFAGDHDAADAWAQKNSGIDFVAKKLGSKSVIEPVFVSTTKNGIQHPIKTGYDIGAAEHLLDLLSLRYRQRLLHDLPVSMAELLAEVGPVHTDDELQDIVLRINTPRQQTAIFDVLMKLREGDVRGAKNRVDLYTHDVKHVGDLRPVEVSELASGDNVVLVNDVDQELFEHFVKTADFQKWMLYLHPSQREYANLNFQGPARLAGVSGSGKTCVLIHRALRLAEAYPDGKILILTLNAALTTLIERLIFAARGARRPNNLIVSSIWQLCLDELLIREPKNRALYTQTTYAPNPHAVSEHIDDIWTEYYLCHNNNDTADRMLGVVQSLNGRGIYPRDYIHQEFDYIRSGLAPSERTRYDDMDRKGRVIPLDRDFRNQILLGLEGWEKKMSFVGAVDDVGIVTALYRHLDQLEPRFRCILVDEVQDLGTLELAIVRRLVIASENDLFLCGDAAQSVYTKCQDYTAAGISLVGRHIRLQQNYRNSRQILAAAYGILKANLESRSKGFVDLEILDPEFANFSSPCPLLLEAESLESEIRHALGYARASVKMSGANKKLCIALCGFSQNAVEVIGKQLEVPVLNGNTDLRSGGLFLADLEQTKGFEFDTVLVLNCRLGVFPHPDLPREESYRELCRFYVAMTRAKIELIVSYHNGYSDFINSEATHFVRGQWGDYATPDCGVNLELPAESVARRFESPDLSLTGHQFIKTIEAVGLAVNLQEELIEHVPGRKGFLDGKQIYWESVAEFIQAMGQPRKRHQILSPEAWDAMAAHFGENRAVPENAPTATALPVAEILPVGPTAQRGAATKDNAIRKQRPVLALKRPLPASVVADNPSTRNICPICSGNGGHNSNCWKCDGTGWV